MALYCVSSLKKNKFQLGAHHPKQCITLFVLVHQGVSSTNENRENGLPSSRDLPFTKVLVSAYFYKPIYFCPPDLISS